MGEMVSYPANGHTTTGYLATRASGTGPGLLVIQEWWGLVDHIKTVADRLAVVDFYGIHPNVPIDPARVKVPVLGHFGTRDGSITPDAVAKIASAVNQAGGRFEPHYYEADHAFFNDTRPQVYNPEAARLAWERTLVFLRLHLGADETELGAVG